MACVSLPNGYTQIKLNIAQAVSTSGRRRNSANFQLKELRLLMEYLDFSKQHKKNRMMDEFLDSTLKDDFSPAIINKISLSSSSTDRDRPIYEKRGSRPR